MGTWAVLLVIPVELCHACVIREAAVYSRCADGHHDDFAGMALDDDNGSRRSILTFWYLEHLGKRTA